MGSAGDPSVPANGSYVVPLPRVTDALGASLRRVFAPRPSRGDFADLLRRLDALR